MFRGWLSLDGVELVNSSRVAAHLGAQVPTNDAAVWGTAGDCALTAADGLAALPDDAQEYAPGLLVPPNGSRIYAPGLVVVGDCWRGSMICGGCRPRIAFDDTWADLQDYLDDTVYRPEMAPWHTSLMPESAEFAGVWLMETTGFGPIPISRSVTEAAGPGGAAGPHRDTSRVLTFDALLVACSNAGLNYGLEWLACQLRETKARSDAVLRYLTAHPAGSDADPDDLVRELHGVVYTKTLSIDDQFAPGAAQQATMYRVSWEMTACNPYAYAPPNPVTVVWDSITPQPISWVHAAECAIPESCDTMPVLFSTECEPEKVVVVTEPPPSCGGCLPVCEVDTYVFALPLSVNPQLCNETTVTVTVRNTGITPLTVQGYWRVAGSNAVCEDNRFPLQIAGLPATAEVTLDGLTGRCTADYNGRTRQPVGIVSTPTGAPWCPPVLDLQDAWELVILAPDSALFTVALVLTDREA